MPLIGNINASITWQVRPNNEGHPAGFDNDRLRAPEIIGVNHDTGTESVSRLIAFSDTATGLATIPHGGDIIVRWEGGSTKIFHLEVNK